MSHCVEGIGRVARGDGGERDASRRALRSVPCHRTLSPPPRPPFPGSTDRGWGGPHRRGWTQPVRLERPKVHPTRAKPRLGEGMDGAPFRVPFHSPLPVTERSRRATSRQRWLDSVDVGVPEWTFRCRCAAPSGAFLPPTRSRFSNVSDLRVGTRPLYTAPGSAAEVFPNEAPVAPDPPLPTPVHFPGTAGRHFGGVIATSPHRDRLACWFDGLPRPNVHRCQIPANFCFPPCGFRRILPNSLVVC